MKTTNQQILQRGVVALAMTLMVAWGWSSTAQAQSESTLHVGVGESVTLTVENVAKLAIAEPTIADIVPLSDKELSVIGKRVGITTLTIVHADKPTQVYRIEVSSDAAATLIRKIVGSSTITARNVGDALILDGYVTDEIEAQRAVQVASAFKGQQVINLIEVRKPRQIRVRTRVVEVNSDAAKNIGFTWLSANGGQVRYALGYNSSGGSVLHGLLNPTTTTLGGQTAGSAPTADAGADVALSLLITKGYARLLSEPTLTTLSGHEASFLVGEEYPIIQTLNNVSTVEYKQIGVRMKVKPTADSQNQVNTVIHAEVSAVGPLTGTQQIPQILTKQADTALQVKDGQTIVIGGLLENNLDNDTLRKVPWLADIPIFGFLFRNKQFHQAQREVLFFLTQDIVKDVDADTAGAAKTPLMKEWNSEKSNQKMLIVPKKGYDWGLQDFDHLGLPPMEPKAASAPQPIHPPTSNFTPARPAGQ